MKDNIPDQFQKGEKVFVLGRFGDYNCTQNGSKISWDSKRMDKTIGAVGVVTRIDYDMIRVLVTTTENEFGPQVQDEFYYRPESVIPLRRETMSVSPGDIAFVTTFNIHKYSKSSKGLSFTSGMFGLVNSVGKVQSVLVKNEKEIVTVKFDSGKKGFDFGRSGGGVWDFYSFSLRVFSFRPQQINKINRNIFSEQEAVEFVESLLN